MNSSIEILTDILNKLRAGDLKQALGKKQVIDDIIKRVYLVDPLSTVELQIIDLLIRIGNIVYNNADLDDSEQLIDNEIYDKLVVKYCKNGGTPQVGADVVKFNNYHNTINTEDLREMVMPYIQPDRENKLFDDVILDMVPNDPYHYYSYCNEHYIGLLPSTKGRAVQHNNPNLVGTLDKVKLVLDQQAKDKGVYDDPTYTIMERDFFRLHFEKGIIEGGQIFGSILSLKYDGISVEAILKTVNGRVIAVSARSRGDTENNIGKDITHIIYGYHFYNADPDYFLEPLGVKFEAVMTYVNLNNYNMERQYNYKNPRSAISSIFNTDEGARYMKYITLIPLETELDKTNEISRLAEIEFMNTQLNTGEYLRYDYIEGDFTSTMFKIKKFVEEADLFRSYLPVMYDGVVFEYADSYIRNILGRKNSINKFAVAVKFNPLKKKSVFRGYSYTVGVTGTITPMIYFDPVDFYGAIHDHASGHSYARFKELNLAIGDILDIDYVNEVMPYVTKSKDNEEKINPNSPEQFITHCPICGTKLVISESGKTVRDPNSNCPGRRLAKMSNMITKLNIRDFSEKSIEKLKFQSFVDMVHATPEDVKILGEVNAEKFLQRMKLLLEEPIEDYKLVGSLGFSNISIITWKLILNYYSLDDILTMYQLDLDNNANLLVDALISIKGVGKVSAETIVDEMNSFMNDLIFINYMNNVIVTKGMLSAIDKEIRIHGFRDLSLIKPLLAQSVNITDGPVTKKTDLLIVDDINNLKGRKVKDAQKYGVPIVSLDEFKANPDKYL